jgi:hypothetical protein
MAIDNDSNFMMSKKHNCNTTNSVLGVEVLPLRAIVLTEDLRQAFQYFAST